MTDQKTTPGTRLAVIGTGPVADLLHEGGEAAGWGVERVAIFPADTAGGAAALADDTPSAIKDADIIAIATPASAHHALAILLAPLVGPGTLVLLVPGQPGGALHFAHAFGADGPIVAETSWAPTVDLADGAADSDAPALPLATVPAEQAEAVVERLAPLLRTEPAPNAFWTALHAPDVVLRALPHLVPTDPPSDTVGELLSGPGADLVGAVERERQQIASALGLEVPTLASWLSSELGTSDDDLLTALGPLGQVPVPDHVDAAWLVDLAPFGLVPLRAIAQYAGVEVPCITRLVEEADRLLGNDYFRAGRTAELMGLTTNGAR